LSTSSQISVVGTAANGKEGVEKALKLKPDVIVTDYMMPEYDGKYLVENVMNQIPTPIILLSALDKADPAIFEVLQAGAFDFVDKPKEKVVAKIRDVNDRLIEAVITASKANLSSLKYKSTKNTHQHTFGSVLNFDAICIGASTGGPSALETVIKKLPKNLPIPVFIAQHMPERFIISFASRLNQISPLPVKIPEIGETIKGGIIYIASGVSNTVLERVGLRVIVGETKETFKEFNHPSIDALMISFANAYRNKGLGVILTGMGKDGTLGLQQLKSKKGATIVQDEKSSVVYGMPKSAVDSGVADHIVPLNDISSFIISCLE
jgi:two-component system chemotaxis response regulator CheB